MRNPPARAYPDWNRASRRPILPTRSAPRCQTVRRNARIALSRRERLNSNASTAFCPRRPRGLRRRDALPKQFDQRRRLLLRHRWRLQSALLPTTPAEPLSRKFRSAARRLARRQSRQMLHPVRPRRASLLRRPKRPPSLRPKPLDRSRRLGLHHRQRLQNAPLRKRPVEPINRFRSVALLPAMRQRDRMPRPSRLRQALLLRLLKRPPLQSRHMLPPIRISPQGKPTGL
jgi:hypothetical protein